MILIRYSTLFEFILADSIPFGTQPANFTHLETNRSNKSDELAAITSSPPVASSHQTIAREKPQFHFGASNFSSHSVSAEQQTQSDDSSNGMVKLESDSYNDSHTTEQNTAEKGSANGNANAITSQLFRATVAQHVNSSPNDFKQNGSIGNNESIGHQFKQQADEPVLALSPSDMHPEALKPTTNATYFVVAVMGGAKIWSRTLSRTLSEIEASLFKNSSRASLKPIYVDLPSSGRLEFRILYYILSIQEGAFQFQNGLPGAIRFCKLNVGSGMMQCAPFIFFRFSVNVLLSLCQQIENRSLAGIVIIGNGQSAHAIAMSGAAMQIPVLWAKGGKTVLVELHPEVT